MDVMTGEPLAVDLLNTRAQTSDGEVDALDSAEDFSAWLTAQGGRIRWVPAPLTRSGLDEIRALREHIRSAIDAARHGVAPGQATLDAITAAAREAPSYLGLKLDADAVVAIRHRDGEGLARFLAELAEAAAELITGQDVGRLRECEGPQCRMLFLPSHPRRRWCSPALCGNRVRVARYYQRHKTSGQPTE
ncbi:hypothetical protein G1H11_04180 [Phytoactinopolyspora alkaliphila]|uniref:Zinc finger CGNR domain-containing protein n=1 Tax=Phytoactinopolyspora alkaliphila TaxID=1783498 RepID=A0A6N9YHN3_9ACTN|nr:ABATE domain-containing protein [Phytoactinopolyspora alkaliphila]NED94503.1 hypothetical protein [Phytoactinopolyspora alkaliphila]